jgi:uncharacterized metal-binding protein YceD (DUF177 family)
MTGTPEFSRPISIEGITPDKVRKEAVEATEEECAALAERFDLRELSDLKAKLSIRRVAGGEVIRIDGAIEADVVQACVVSLRDVHSRVESKFETFFTEDSIDEDDEDAPEMVSNGYIDLGEVVAQYLSLELDPYPRAPGVSLAAQMAEVGVKAPDNPFKVLEGMKKKPAKPAAKAKAKAKPAKKGKKR